MPKSCWHLAPDKTNHRTAIPLTHRVKAAFILFKILKASICIQFILEHTRSLVQTYYVLFV